MPPTPKPFLAVALLAAAAAIAASVLGGVSSLRAGGWMTFAFDLFTLGAGVVGLITGLGRFKDSHVLAFFCVAGSLLAAPPLAGIAAGAATAGTSADALRMFARDLLRDPDLAARLAAGAVFLALTVLLLLSRRPRASGGHLARAALAGLPLVAIAWITGQTLEAMRTITPDAWVRPKLGGMIADLSPPILATLAFVAFLTSVVLASAAGHFLIRALEVGKAEPKAA